MTTEEQTVVNYLKDAWNAFLELPVKHPDDLHDFRKAIHDAQRIVMCRDNIRLGE